MGDIAEAFEQHLRSLSDEQWNALTARVRTPAPQAPPAPQLPNEVEQTTEFGSGSKAGLDEAKRRGFIDGAGKPVRSR